MKDSGVDIVIPWVDGNDSSWQARYFQYSGIGDGDKRAIRFRDWGLLVYLFRGIEAFAPWVRKVHFVTSGELPEWLNLNNPKLLWVKHEDFIPAEYLPTFNINAIETNIHRIEGLSEKFIYFNDDTFLLKESSITDFFQDDKPCDYAILDPIFPESYPYIFVNGILALNRHFDKHTVIKENFSKWINLKYGKYLLKSLLLLPWKRFPGLLWHHLPQAYRKETFEEVWNAEPDILNKTGLEKFRSGKDVNQWIFRYWHLAKGDFTPSNRSAFGESFEISASSVDKLYDIISCQKMKQICLNDGEDISDYEELSKKLQHAFDRILPQKSSFEK